MAQVRTRMTVGDLSPKRSNGTVVLPRVPRPRVGPRFMKDVCREIMEHPGSGDVCAPWILRLCELVCQDGHKPSALLTTRNEQRVVRFAWARLYRRTAITA